MKLEDLVEMNSDGKVAMKSTMYKTDKGTITYPVSDACQHYLYLKLIDKNTRKANEFVNDLVEYHD